MYEIHRVSCEADCHTFIVTFSEWAHLNKEAAPGRTHREFLNECRRLALPVYAPYAATKWAVETLTNIFAKELRGREISVNAVAPGPTATDLLFNGKTPEQIAHMSKMAPLERLGRPEDIPASSHSSWVPMGLGSTDKPCERTEVSSEDSNS